MSLTVSSFATKSLRRYASCIIPAAAFRIRSPTHSSGWLVQSGKKFQLCQRTRTKQCLNLREEHLSQNR